VESWHGSPESKISAWEAFQEAYEGAIEVDAIVNLYISRMVAEGVPFALA
jgi:hypothetical protein